MLTLTEKAVGQVQKVLASQEDPEAFQGIRISVMGGGCSGFQYAMKLEKEGHDEDQIFQSQGFNVFVDEQSLLYLDGTEIDFVETPQGSGFKFNNPNVKSTCGCGESFKA